MANEWLTQEQVDQLPAGVLVEVTWSGGNGPHVYQTYKDRFGYLYVGTPGHPLTDYRHSLGFVGAEQYHTRVRLVQARDTPEDSA